MKSKQMKKAVIILCVLVIIIVVGLAAVYIGKNMKKQDTPTASSRTEGQVNSQKSGNTVFYNGKEYEYNKKLTNILFMGIDKSQEVALQDTPGTAGQADCLMIISMNSEDKTARLLQISRDAMTEVDLYDVSGNYFTSVEAQIATQYAYGNGVQSSCWATKKTVSELLYELPIDGYLSVNLDGIRALNDMLGGVTLTIPKDYTSIDPAFTEGTTITLTGEQAERYIRYRDTSVSGSNSGRMERQLQYIPALINAIRSKAGKAGDYYNTFYPILKPYLVTDMSGDQINDLARYQLDVDHTEVVPGEVVEGKEHDEFYVDDEKLYELIINMFYKTVN